MKKRIFATLAALLTLAMALTACGAPAADTKTDDAANTSGETGSSEPTANIAVVFSTLGDLNFNDWCWEGICQAVTTGLLSITWKPLPSARPPRRLTHLPATKCMI